MTLPVECSLCWNCQCPYNSRKMKWPLLQRDCIHWVWNILWLILYVYVYKENQNGW